MGIGPQLPPHLQGKRKHGDSSDSFDSNSDSESQGPLPDTKRPRTSGPSRPAIGPALPPQDHLAADDPDVDDSSSSSDDNEYGPEPPAAENGSNTPVVSAFDQPSPAKEEPAPISRRDDWMMAPPKQGDLASRIDPTKMRARGFNTGKSAGSFKAADTSIWTETPEQRRKRLQDQVMGVKSAEASSADQPRDKRKDKENAEKARKIQEHNQKYRPQSLVEQHQMNTSREQEDDPSKRAFDYEKDIAGGTTFGGAARREMMKKAGDFGSRFSKGNYL